MDIIRPIAIFLLTLCATAIISIIVYKSSKKNNPLKIGLLLGSVHFIIVVLFDIIIKLALKTHPESGFIWFLVAFIDLPVVLMFKYLKMDFMYLSPYIAFGIFGTLQYFLLGILIVYLYNKINK